MMAGAERWERPEWRPPHLAGAQSHRAPVNCTPIRPQCREPSGTGRAGQGSGTGERATDTARMLAGKEESASSGAGSGWLVMPSSSRRPPKDGERVLDASGVRCPWSHQEGSSWTLNPGPRRERGIGGGPEQADGGRGSDGAQVPQRGRDVGGGNEGKGGGGRPRG